MKVLILGGSGILSTDFTKKMIEEGNEVWILNRGRRLAFIDDRAKLIIADLRNESADELRSKVASYDFDVIVDFLSYEPRHLEKIYLYSLRSLLNIYLYRLLRLILRKILILLVRKLTKWEIKIGYILTISPFASNT